MDKVFFYWKRFLLFFLPLFCFSLPLLIEGFFTTPPGKLTLLSVWMIFWWAFEVVPIPVTSLLPLVFYPLFQVTTEKEVVVNYARPIIFLFMGGFFLAKALERTGLHRRLALKVLSRIGGSYGGVLLAFMLTSFFLSMWISNTATTLLMLSVASGVLLFFEGKEEGNLHLKKFSVALFLGIAYSSSIGGTATLIGTPPNGLLASYLKKQHGLELSMLEWIKQVLPFSLLLLGFLWFWLAKVIFKSPKKVVDPSEYLKEEESKLGFCSYDEKVVSMTLVLTALAWCLRPLLVRGFQIFLSDAMIALFGALVLFCWPSKERKGFILDWESATTIPWGVLLMFGGGLSMASAFKSTGLLQMVADSLVSLPEYSPRFLLFVFCGSALFLTETLTNSAAMATLLPLLTIFSERYGLPVTYLAIPATLCCSFAFMLPIATPPNAIVFSSGRVRLSEMILTGFGLNLLAILAILVYFS